MTFFGSPIDTLRKSNSGVSQMREAEEGNVNLEKEIEDGNAHNEAGLSGAFVDRLVELRLRSGLSFETVAQWLELNEDQMQLVESGDWLLSDLRPHHVPLLCELFGVTPDEFFGDLSEYKKHFRKNKLLDDETLDRLGLPKEAEKGAA